MRHFHYKTLPELRQSAEAVGAVHIRFEEDPGKIKSALGRKVQIGGVSLGNSIAIHPMEGCDGTLDGRPDQLTFRRYGRFGASGAKLIWFEATAVSQLGRSNTRELWLHQGSVADFARLLEMTRHKHREVWGTSDDLLEPLQLTHSGRYSVPKRVIAHHNPLIDRKSGTPADWPVISDGELERLEDDYVEAARLAVQAGFRAVDIKAAHGYLVSELLGAKLREGRYGGSLENRTRFIRNILGKIRAALGNRLILAIRLGCFDGIPYDNGPAGIGVPYERPVPYPYGFGVNPANPLEEDLAEVKQAIAWFQEWGVALVNVSMGSPYQNPHIGRPFDKPDEGNYEPPEHPLAGVDRHFRIAGELQRAFPGLPMVGTGYSWLQKYAIHAAAANLLDGNIAIFGMGRNALAYPEFARDALEKGELDERRVCKTLTYCTYLMRQKHHPLGQFPTGCPPFDKEVYGPIVKLARVQPNEVN
jgi:2,4-dienoyl-CoA reductase-like NADH-dependent reductase (Old Yellow Enzyme family)